MLSMVVNIGWWHIFNDFMMVLLDGLLIWRSVDVHAGGSGINGCLVVFGTHKFTCLFAVHFNGTRRAMFTAWELDDGATFITRELFKGTFVDVTPAILIIVFVEHVGWQRGTATITRSACHDPLLLVTAWCRHASTMPSRVRWWYGKTTCGDVPDGTPVCLGWVSTSNPVLVYHGTATVHRFGDGTLRNHHPRHNHHPTVSMWKCNYSTGTDPETWRHNTG